MQLRKINYTPQISYYKPAMTEKYRNPKISQLEYKIETLKSKLNMNPDMLPAKKAEIEAEIENAKMYLSSEPRVISYLI